MFLRNSKYSQENTCWSLFLIKLRALRPATLLKRESSTGIFLWILVFSSEYFEFFKNTYFQKYLRTATSVRSPILKNICEHLLLSNVILTRTTYSFKILVSNRKYENNLKNRESQKNIYFTILMFYYQIPWFYQDFKSQNLCF